MYTIGNRRVKRIWRDFYYHIHSKIVVFNILFVWVQKLLLEDMKC